MTTRRLWRWKFSSLFFLCVFVLLIFILCFFFVVQILYYFFCVEKNSDFFSSSVSKWYIYIYVMSFNGHYHYATSFGCCCCCCWEIQPMKKKCNQPKLPKKYSNDDDIENQSDPKKIDDHYTTPKHNIKILEMIFSIWSWTRKKTGDLEN